MRQALITTPREARRRQAPTFAVIGAGDHFVACAVPQRQVAQSCGDAPSTIPPGCAPSDRALASAACRQLAVRLA